MKKLLVLLLIWSSVIQADQMGPVDDFFTPERRVEAYHESLLELLLSKNEKILPKYSSFPIISKSKDLELINMISDIESSVDEAVAAALFLKRKESLDFISEASDLIAQCFSQGGKVLIAGNGGSLCDAMHFAEELTGRFRENRKALPALALSDPGYLTCVANDFGFDRVFSRGVEAFGNAGDIFIALTTSGNSDNLYQALLAAREKGLGTICFLGKTGGEMRGMADLEWLVSGFPYSDRIQEAHMAAGHIIIEMVEKKLFQPALKA